MPLSKNKYLDFGYKNHNAIKRKRAEYKEIIYWLMYEQIHRLELLYYKKATITFDIYFKVNRRRDKQNYLGGGLISWLDAMIYLRLIKWGIKITSKNRGSSRRKNEMPGKHYKRQFSEAFLAQRAINTHNNNDQEKGIKYIKSEHSTADQKLVANIISHPLFY